MKSYFKSIFLSDFTPLILVILGFAIFMGAIILNSQPYPQNFNIGNAQLTTDIPMWNQTYHLGTISLILWTIAGLSWISRELYHPEN